MSTHDRADQVRRIDTVAEKLILLPKGNQDIPETTYGIDSLDDSY